MQSVVRSCLHELRGENEKAGEERIIAIRHLPKNSPYLSSETELAATLLNSTKQDVAAKLGLSTTTQKATDATSFDLSAIEPAVVWILCEQSDGTIGSGSGFAISTDGFLITNAHVVDGAQTISVKYWDGVIGKGDIVAIDRKRDLALVRIARRDLPALPMEEKERPPIGTTVFAVGNPSGLERTVTRGIISGYREREGVTLIQTDAAINPGNSGGPILDEKGRIIGVATWKISNTEGLGFGVATESIASFVKQYVH